MTRPAARRAHPERLEQQQIVQVLEWVGAKVYTLGTTRKRGDHQGTMQTAGLADLLAFLPYEHRETRRGEQLLVVEVKSATGRMSDAQVEFAEHCNAAGIDHVVGGLAAVVRWLLDAGYLGGTIDDWWIPKRQLPQAFDLESLKAVQEAFARAFPNGWKS